MYETWVGALPIPLREDPSVKIASSSGGITTGHSLSEITIAVSQPTALLRRRWGGRGRTPDGALGGARMVRRHLACDAW